ncbi:MAG: alpha-amylase family glycosyl hydrolase [Hyphomonas sp.]|nr:alpha-amylase family glycosyl hydrolase [Hyphomonas sp.]
MNQRISTAIAAFALTACVHVPTIEGASQTAIAEATRYAPTPYVEIDHPDWADDAVIYQINTRQFTPEGTFKAAQEHLPRLRDLGVDILWLMPIHPIGEVNRKGSLGSPYAVKDYFGVNPEFGTEEDFRSFVDAAHAQGFKVILDWVANHTAWDNPMVTENPDWYETDWKGDFHPTPWTDWADIIDLDYSNPELRAYKTSALKYWVEEYDIDGYRCDVAGFVPIDFWETARAELNQIKPVFMLAEWQQRDLHRKAFDATYAWAWKEAAQRIAKGQSDAGDLRGYLSEQISTWPLDAYRMLYTENHDQNAWDGSTGAIYGDAYHAMLTLSFVTEGIPLIHNGQEVGNQNQLEFFERDPIDWGSLDHPDGELIKRLIRIKSENAALHNGAAGGRIIPVSTDNPSQVLSFSREKDGNQVLVFFNLSGAPADFRITDGPAAGAWTDALTGDNDTISLGAGRTLAPWQGVVLITNKDKD